MPEATDGHLLAQNDGHRVVIANLAQYYDAWIEAARASAALDFVFQWKIVANGGGRRYEYLYRMTDSGRGLGTSLMRRSPEAEAVVTQHAKLKASWQLREEERYARLMQEARQYRALRLGMISSPGARILQMLDIHGVLGSQYMVVGTNALPVYEIEAGERFARGVDATEDFDLAWVGGTLHLSPAQAVVAQAPVAQLLALAEDALLLRLLNESPSDLMALLRRLDRTYTPNTERTFQARNAKGYEVELLSGTSLRSMPQSGSPSLVPLPLPEQDWLLLGKPVAHVITGLDACPARLVAPDPRYFALQKLWLARQAKRKVEKRAKDARQATLVLDAVARSMPDYPLNDAFADALPTPLQVLFSEWQTTRTTESSSADSLKTKRW